MRHPAQILIVEDNPDSREILAARLQALGYAVITAPNGEAGLSAAAENLPDLILLDVMMPGLDGYQVCQELKASELTSEIPVIFVTALNEAKDEAKGFELGAADFITKPVSPSILKARVKTHLTLKQNLEALREAYCVIDAQKNRMQDELNVGRRIQMNMVPGKFPPFPERREISIYASLNPASEVGGDLYNYFFIDENRLCFCLGDVSGKGVPAALFMAVTQTLIESLAMAQKSTAGIVNRANTHLCRNNEAFMFVTLFLGILDLRDGGLIFTNGGHNSPLILGIGGGARQLPHKHGPAVGNLDDMTWGQDSLLLAPGETLLIFSDGVTEACNLRQELFSLEGLLSFLESNRFAGVEEMVNGISRAVSEYEDGASQCDDITLLAIKYHGA